MDQPLSVVQMFGFAARRMFYLLALAIIGVFAIITAWASAAFVAGLVDGFFQTLGLAVAAVAIDAAKMLLPVKVYDARFRAPGFCRGMFVLFCLCFLFSLVFSIGWAVTLPESDGTAKTLAELNAGQSPLTWVMVLLLSQIITAGGPVAYVASTKGATELPYDEAPKQAAPQSLPDPSQFQGPMAQPPAGDAYAAFSLWVPQVLSRDPGGQVSLGQALANFNSWASARGYSTANAEQFAPWMADAAQQNGGYASNGQFVNVSIAGASNQYVDVY